jgi:hypothetical protein
LGLHIRNHFAAPVTLLTLFLLVTGIPPVTVAWLGWRLLEQSIAATGNPSVRVAALMRLARVHRKQQNTSGLAL